MNIKYLVLIVLTGVISSCTLTSTAPSDQGPKQALGTVTGMVLGEKSLMISLKIVPKIIYGHLLE